jgi:hypothetical protein
MKKIEKLKELKKQTNKNDIEYAILGKIKIKELKSIQDHPKNKLLGRNNKRIESYIPIYNNFECNIIEIIKKIYPYHFDMISRFGSYNKKGTYYYIYSPEIKKIVDKTFKIFRKKVKETEIKRINKYNDYLNLMPKMEIPK